MSECKTCGRDDGHNLGCMDAHPYQAAVDYDAPLHAVEIEAVEGDALTLKISDKCTVGGCPNARRSTDKRVKFCETHSDPKNRK